MSEYPLTEKWKQRALDAEKRIAELEAQIETMQSLVGNKPPVVSTFATTGRIPPEAE